MDTTTHRETARARDRVARLVRAHPVAALLLWSATAGQAVVLVPLAVAPELLAADPQPFVVTSTLVGLLLPAVVVTAVADGRAGLRSLLRRAVRVRVAPGWYALALVGVPLTALAVTAVLTGALPGAVEQPLGLVVAGLLAPALVGLVTVTLAEEVAWTGVVQARLADRHGPLRAALVVGPLFALQHSALLAGGSVAGTAVALLLLAALAVPFRALTGWVHQRTSSVLVVAVLHAAGNAVAAPGGLLARLFPGEAVVSAAHLIALAVLGAAVVVLTRVRLGRRTGDPPTLAAPEVRAPVSPGGART